MRRIKITKKCHFSEGIKKERRASNLKKKTFVFLVLIDIFHSFFFLFEFLFLMRKCVV